MKLSPLRMAQFEVDCIKDWMEAVPEDFFNKKLFLSRISNMNNNVSSSDWKITPSGINHNIARVEDLILHSRSIQFLTAGVSSVSESLSFICPTSFDLAEWVSASFKAVHMVRPGSAIGVFYPEGATDYFESILVCVTHRLLNVSIDVSGTLGAIKEFKKWVSNQGFKAEEVMIEWVFGPNYKDMEGFSLPLQMYPPIPGAYPWMKESVEEYSQRFFDSKESVLVLKGQPGTGKTSFIKQIIQSSKTSALVTYDTALLFSDGFFASFMTREDCNLLIIEDADNMLQSREEGNPLMDRLLNASDGLISLRNKKIIFSTNLGNVSAIDAALLRKGRCFDILDFRKLTREEALLVAAGYYGKDVQLEGSSFSLAEITNIDMEQMKLSKPITKLGFA